MEGFLMFMMICSFLIIFPSAAAGVQLCNSTIKFYDFTSGPRIWCSEQSARVRLSNFNGDFVEVTGLKGYNCGENSAAVEAPCDYCLVTVNVSPARMVPGLVTVSREGMSVKNYYFDFPYQLLSDCPGFNVATDVANGSGRKYFLIPTTCVYRSRALDCPSCLPSGTCMYSIKLDAQSSFCLGDQPIEVSIHNDFDRRALRGSGISAAFQAFRKEFQRGIHVMGRCVDFCSVGVQIYDTSCSYQVNRVSVSGYNISRTFQVGANLKPVRDFYTRNYAGVYSSQCGLPTPYRVRIRGRDVYIPRECKANTTAKPARITCSCQGSLAMEITGQSA